MWRVGVDAGGTFTDICLVDEASGGIRVWKVPSTPDDPSRAIALGVVEGLRAAGADAAAVGYLGHGTTVATNALLQHRGAPTGLITTEGFRDLLEIGRQRRPHLYDLQADKPPTLVPRARRFEVAERLRHDGRVERALDESQVRTAARALRDAGARSIAVCFLYCYVDPAHERRAREIVEEELPEAFVTCSHEVAPEFREYERLSTVVVNAYLGPVMDGYIARLGPRLAGAGVRVPAHITQSNGGVMSLETARAQPVGAVLSGPATGVVGGLDVGLRAGFRSLVTFDMGGTSTDVSLIEDGRPRLARELEVHGYPLKMPALDIHTVGAGGGSIAFVDPGGLLKVGPRSAGAVPGPVCYGLGGEEPTVTDANVVLQTLNPTHLLGGRMAIDRARAAAAIHRLAGSLGLDVMATAQGIVSVVTATMARAIRVISVQRGHDSRDYTLVAFGGAGPLHAARLARELEIPRIVVPRNPGILCALGLLLSDLKTNFAQTRLMPVTAGAWAAMVETFEALERRAAAWFDREGIAPGARAVRRTVDMRYAGQNYELPVAFPDGPQGEAVLGELRAGFERAHEQIYGYVAAEEPIQAVTFRLEAVGAVRRAELRAHPPAGTEASTAIVGRRDVWLAESAGFASCPVYDRDKLGAGHRLDGPAVIEQMDATTLLLAGQTVVVDPYLNLIVEVGG
ncbi:MAG: hydantoinase/oxoprolinase family protein [Candidatus Rokubacteria bacterium]|nr:hydantoinase/oxoprolinase family protein [Candidatus Rokubacteria bacterium]